MLVGGLAGAIGGYLLQYYTSVVDYPLNVGGRPLNSLPAFVPVTFEIMVLFAGVGTVLAFFLVSRLWFGRKPRVLYEGVTDDRFVLVLEETDAAFDVEAVRALFERYHLVAMEERVEDSGRLVPRKEKVE